MTRLEARAILAVNHAQQRALTRLAAALAADLPDLHVEIDGDRVIVTGRGVLDDPRLVWIGSVLR
ncbi:MAG: hypothetical protein J0J06_12555 [Sphingomonas sp.]|uniref:hypothetical protein n=1 Tax=Sphingomonas sp. TaxID=28214 RepID=UPI001AC87AF8|nr:hypothetical protein [Sphingomonas sp.]MBN8816265.1 hypothetical protein [Sphingomonas sp.]